MKKCKLLSFVIPCYRSEKTIETVINEIIYVVSSRSEYDYEIIAVNDDSPDSVYQVLLELSKCNRRIKVINLVKNMGKHAAVLAGYSFVEGDYVVNLDDDYQSPINNLWDLLNPLENGSADVAIAKYIQKKESLWKRIGSNINLRISEIMLDKPKGMRFENLSVMKRFVAEEMVKYRNPYPFLEGLILRVTKKIVVIPMEQRDRGDNKSTGFTFWKSVSLFANGFTNFSVKPIRIALIIGVLFAFVGFAYGVYIVVRRLAVQQAPMGWSSLMAVLLLATGLNMLLLGIIGEYVGRIFICINDSPQYVVRNTINVLKDDANE